MKRIIYLLLLVVLTLPISSHAFLPGFTGASGGGGAAAGGACNVLQDDNATDGAPNGVDEDWGKNATIAYLGTQFTYGGTDAKQICKVCVYTVKIGSPAATMDMTIGVWGDSGSDPNNADIKGTSDSYTADTFPASDDWYCLDFSTPTSALSNGTTYWIVGIADETNTSNYVGWYKDTATTTTLIKKDDNGVSPWTTQVATHGLMFRIYSQ